MPRAVIYMPYDPKHPTYMAAQIEYGDKGSMKKNAKILEYLTAKGFKSCEVWYNGAKDPQIRSLDVGKIFIRGHGMPGDPTIEGGRTGERIDFTTVADRLIQSGLPKTFSGEIHLYNCHSAESGDGQVSTDKRPFSQMFADYFFTNGYKASKFFGYLGSIDSFEKDGSGGKNIYARNKAQNELGTWDQARVGIRPTINMVTKTQRLKAFFGKK